MSRQIQVPAYADGMAVEIFDHVELHLPEGIFDGQVAAIWPRRGEVRVTFGNYAHPRRDGEPRRRSCIALVQQIELIRRDG